MAQRRFLPALRGLTESKSLQPSGPSLQQQMQAEEKVITLGVGFSSTSFAGTSNLAGEDRAAGYDLQTVIVEGYERVVWVWKSVEFYSNHFSRLPFVIGRDRDTPDEELLARHPLYRVLNGRANPHETGRALRKRLSAQVLLSKKGAFVEVTRSRAGTITRLDLLAPDRVLPIPSTDGLYVSHFEYTMRSGGVREIPTNRILWIKDPHPTDPFCGVTPLDPAGASVDLDKKARQYNVSFIDNDARPGGIVGVDADTLTDAEMRRVESRFAPGAHEAGKISVIATGPGGLRYIDTTTRPRDMAYGEMAANAKAEILSAFGLSESLFGQSAGRTYDNAEQDKFNAWTENLVPHFDLISSAFLEELDYSEGWMPWIDTRTVEVLEIPRRKAREEARAEFAAGLRSVNEYRPMAGLKPIDNAYSRALWISPSKAPIPLLPSDAEALGLASPEGAAGAPPEGEVIDGSEVPAALGAGTAADAVAEARGDTGLPTGTAADAVTEARLGGTPRDSAAGAVASARLSPAAETQTDAADVVRMARETKALQGPGDPEPPRGFGPTEYAPGEEEARRVELAVAAALEATLSRQQQVLLARLESPKTRRGTRFWQADGPTDVRGGSEPIDMAKAVDAERWATEAVESVQPIAQQGTAESGAGLLVLLAGIGIVASAPAPSAGAPWLREAAVAGVGVTLSALQHLGESVVEWLNDLTAFLAVEERTAADIDALGVALRRYHGDRARSFIDGVALSVAQGVVNGGREAVASALVPLPGTEHIGITREWVSRRDDRVRSSHRLVDGDVGPVGEPWRVGEALLRFPGDPQGPLDETAGCRCRCFYRVAPQARLILPPVSGA